MININYNEQEEENINAFFQNQSEIEQNLQKPDRAAKLFAIIYIAYLRSHPKQLCQVLFAYFQMNLMENKYYQGFLHLMIMMLGHFADEYLSPPVIQGQPELKEWKNIMDIVNSDIDKYESLSEELFSQHGATIQIICAHLQEALQMAKTTPIEQEVKSMGLSPTLPRDSSPGVAIVSQPEGIPFSPEIERIADVDQNLHGQPQQLKEQPQQLEEQVQSTPTMWQNLTDLFSWIGRAITSFFWATSG